MKIETDCCTSEEEDNMLDVGLLTNENSCKCEEEDNILAVGLLTNEKNETKLIVIATIVLKDTFAADTAKKIAEVVIQNHKEKLMGVTGLLQPGQKYLSLTGGLFDGPVEIERIPKHIFDRLEIVTTKTLRKRRKRRKSKHFKEERIKEDFGFKQRQSGIIE